MSFDLLEDGIFRSKELIRHLHYGILVCFLHRIVGEIVSDGFVPEKEIRSVPLEESRHGNDQSIFYGRREILMEIEYFVDRLF